MAAERYVVLGLAAARSPWFGSVSHWANSGLLAAEFVKCISAEEVRARLGSGRLFSALLADGRLPAVDRDLIAAAVSAGCPVIVVEDGRVSRDWPSLGAAAVLPAQFGPDDLASVVAVHGRHIPRDSLVADEQPAAPAPWRGTVVVVTGPGGTGASTAAIAMCQALGNDVRREGMAVLADLRLHAEQAMLHDARDLVPGIQELVEAHRNGAPTPEDVRALSFAVRERNYHLLLGLRRAALWPALRPHAFAAAFDSLQRAYRVVVCDTDPDLEGEDDCGSLDVEERHVMARTAAARAHAVFVVGLPTLKGLHALVRVIDALRAFGVASERIVPVLNRAPRSPRVRARLASAVAELGGVDGGSAFAGPVFLPERRIEEALHDGTRLPAALGDPLARALRAVLDRAGAPPQADPVPARVRPGSLGRWGDDAAVNG